MWCTLSGEDEINDERRPLLSSQISSASSSASCSVSSPGLPVNERADDDRRAADETKGGGGGRGGGEGSRTGGQRCSSCLRSYVPIEPLLFVYAFCRAVVIALNGFYFFDVASRMNGDPSMSSLNPCGGNGTGGVHPDRRRAENVQAETLKLGMIVGVSGFLSAIFPTIFLGPATDSLGRRVGLVLPLLGLIIRSLVFLFVLATDISIYFLILGVIVEGASGSLGGFMLTAFSAAADITTPGRQRSLRICIVEAMQVVGAALALFVVGQWRHISYTQPVMMATATSVVCLIYTLWGWPETRLISGPETTTAKNTEEPVGQRGTPGCDLRTGSGPSDPPDPPSQPDRSSDGFSSLPAQQVSACQVMLATSPGQGLHKLENVQRVGINYDMSDGFINSDRDSFASSSESSFEACSGAGFAPGQRLTSRLVRQKGCERQHSSVSLVPESASLQDHACEETIPRSVSAETSNSASFSSSCATALGNVRKSWAVYFRSDETSHPNRRRVLALCFFSFLLASLVHAAKPAVEYVFRMGELCWNAAQESNFNSASLVIQWVVIFVVLHVLQKRLHVPDVYMALIGCLSALSEPLVFSFATLPSVSDHLANVLVFAAAGCGIVTRVLIPMLRSMASAVITLEEQGALFSSFAFAQLFGPALFDMAAVEIYNVTVHVWQGIIFIILAALIFVVFIMLIFLVAIHRKSRRRELQYERNIRRVPELCQHETKTDNT